MEISRNRQKIMENQLIDLIKKSCPQNSSLEWKFLLNFSRILYFDVLLDCFPLNE